MELIPRVRKPVKPFKKVKVNEAWPETSAFISNIRTLMDNSREKLLKEA